MKQQSLEASGFEIYRKKTRKEIFLEEMEQIIPWTELCEVIAPYYPKSPDGAGRPPVGLDRMLRIHFLQHWFELSDPAAEEALYDSRAMRLFVGIDLGKEPVPDETCIFWPNPWVETRRPVWVLALYMQNTWVPVIRWRFCQPTISSAGRMCSSKIWNRPDGWRKKAAS